MNIQNIKSHYVTVIIEAKNGKEELLKNELLNIQKFSLQESTCLDYKVIQDSNNAAQFVLFETWTSKEDHEKQFQKRYIVDFANKLENLLNKPYQLIIGSNATAKPKEHELICFEPWFDYIKKGIKPVEGRKNSSKYSNINEGDYITFINEKSDKFKAKVTKIKKYVSLEDYLKDVTIEKAVPGTKSFQDAVNIYHQWNNQEEINKYGFLGIFVELVTSENLA